MRTNNLGLAIAISFSGGDVSDYVDYRPIMDEAERKPKVMIADKGYDSDAIGEDLAWRVADPIIPPRKNHKV